MKKRTYRENMKEFNIKYVRICKKNIVRKRKCKNNVKMNKTILRFSNNNIEMRTFHLHICTFHFIWIFICITSFRASKSILNTLLDIHMLIKLYHYV